MHILLIFVDGMGLGANDPATNPFLSAPSKTLRALFGAVPTNANGRLTGRHAILVPTDACLGVPGLPQSGTGQTTIFTGVNAPAAIGQHLGPYPNEALREILMRDNVFMQVRALGLSAAFANAYPPFFFDRLARGKTRRTATMQAAIAAGVRIRDIDDLARGEAVSGLSMTNQFWIERLGAREDGAPVPLITPRRAGRNLMRIARENDFTAFEYAPPDIAGHKDNRHAVVEVLNELDQFLGGVVHELEADAAWLRHDLVIVTSDHGNVEDWTVRGHTLNPVPTILIGARREQIAPHIHALTDITPAIVELL